jgi:hypothetical protein
VLGRCLPSRPSDRENECSVSDRAMQIRASALTAAGRSHTTCGVPSRVSSTSDNADHNLSRARSLLTERYPPHVQCPRTFYTDLDTLICKIWQTTRSGWSTQRI